MHCNPGATTYLRPSVSALAGIQCFGLTQGYGNSLTACQDQCCNDQTCTIWQWDASNSGGPCWIGSDCSDNTTSAGWTSFARDPPGPTPVPRADCTDPGQPCSVGFNDAPWRNVNTPHGEESTHAYFVRSMVSGRPMRGAR